MVQGIVCHLPLLWSEEKEKITLGTAILHEKSKRNKSQEQTPCSFCHKTNPSWPIASCS